MTGRLDRHLSLLARRRLLERLTASVIAAVWTALAACIIIGIYGAHRVASTPCLFVWWLVVHTARVSLGALTSATLLSMWPLREDGSPSKAHPAVHTVASGFLLAGALLEYALCFGGLIVMGTGNSITGGDKAACPADIAQEPALSAILAMYFFTYLPLMTFVAFGLMRVLVLLLLCLHAVFCHARAWLCPRQQPARVAEERRGIDDQMCFTCFMQLNAAHLRGSADGAASTVVWDGSSDAALDWCTLCGHGFTIGMRVVCLPCASGHAFHVSCAHAHVGLRSGGLQGLLSCPVDGTPMRGTALWTCACDDPACECIEQQHREN